MSAIGSVHPPHRPQPYGPAAAMVVLVVAIAIAFAKGGSPLKSPPVTTAAPTTKAGDAKKRTTKPPSTQPKGESFTLSWVGDMMIGSTTPSPELLKDPNKAFASVKDLLVADLVAGNLEGPLADKGPTNKCEGQKAGTCFVFSQPPDYAKVYKDAGFMLLDLANNHSKDRGDEGLQQTVEALTGAGIRFAGVTGQPPADFPDVKGNHVRAVAFATNVNPYKDLAAVKAQVAEAGKDGAVVVVLLHAGKEGADAQSVKDDPAGGDIIAFAHTAIDAGADVVLGSGPHVLRGMEFYKGRLVAYSLGNFATYGKFNLVTLTRRTAVLHVTLAPDGAFVSGKIDPVRLVDDGIPEPGGNAIPTVKELSEKDFGEAGAKVADDGTFTP